MNLGYKVYKQTVNGQEVELVEYLDEHWYKIGDQYYPSISKKLGIIDKGYGFIKWNQQVGMNAPLILEEASERGNLIHNAIESNLMGNEVTCEQFKRKADWEDFNLWADWWDYYGFKPKFIEQIVWDDELRTAGKLDCIAEREGKFYVFDWKSGNIYDSYYEQLLFYWNCSVKMGLVPKESEIYLVQIGSDHKKIDEKKLQGVGVGLKKVVPEEISELLASSLRAFDLRNPEIKPPHLVFPARRQVKNILKGGE